MKYNKRTESEVKVTSTFEHGKGFTQKPEKELIGILSTGISNSFYEKENERIKRLETILTTVANKNLEFAAKALIYARTVFEQRTVTHIGAVSIIPLLSGKELGKRFFSKRDRKENKGGVIFRLDDMAEILSIYKIKNGEDAPIPNAIKKGFKEAIEKSDAYQLAKYQMSGKGVSLVDIVNLVHPKGTLFNGFVKVPLDKFQKAITGTKFEKEYDFSKLGPEENVMEVHTLKALVLGVLKQFNTVEDKNTEAGKTVAKKVKKGEITAEQAKVELNEAKTENYADLIREKKIGYLALLRNLRNILKTKDVDLLNKACDLLVEKDFIVKSKVFPYQIDLCAEVLMTEFNGKQLQKAIISLNEAYEKSIPNLAELFNAGKSVIVLDVSGSMSTHIQLNNHKQGSVSALDKGALIAATLAKGIGIDLFVFANSCERARFNPTDSVNTIKNSLIQGNNVGGGTKWSSIFPRLEKEGKYDMVWIISDEQGCDDVEYSYKNYCNKFGIPDVFVVNICGYAPTMIKESTKVHKLYGYSEAIYETAKKVQLDIDAIITEINSIVI